MKKGSGGALFIVLLLVSVAVIILLAVWSAKQDVKELEQIKQQEIIQEQNAQEMGDAMQGIKDDIEQGYEDLDKQIEE
ncbi:MAG: hypothetical protein IKR23_10540 [Lachnospiraceae bacterium]|nr:hypothetical protein [Lachnospiraceae bacterium]